MTVDMPTINVADDAASIAATFVDARRRAVPVPDYPGAVPASLDAGYLIQDHAIALNGGTIAGWKVGRIWPPNEGLFASNRLAGPIFASGVVEAGEVPNVMPVFVGGFGAVEAEFIYALGDVDPVKTEYSLQEAAAVVASVHVGIEIASSPLAAINELGPAVTVSDFGNNHGLIVGPAIADWRNVDDWPIEVTINGVSAGTGFARDFPDGTLGSVRFLLELLARRGIAVPAGTLISTGAITGVHSIAVGQSATARFGDKAKLHCTIVKAAPASA